MSLGVRLLLALAPFTAACSSTQGSEGVEWSQSSDYMQIFWAPPVTDPGTGVAHIEHVRIALYAGSALSSGEITVLQDTNRDGMLSAGEYFCTYVLCPPPPATLAWMGEIRFPASPDVSVRGTFVPAGDGATMFVDLLHK